MKKNQKSHLAAAAGLLILLAAALIFVMYYDDQKNGDRQETARRTEEQTQETKRQDSRETEVEAENSQRPHTQTQIVLGEEGTLVSGEGVLLQDGRVNIVQGGAYRISGTLENGQLYVEADDETVELIFSGVSITNESEAAVHIEKADQAVITLAQGTENRLQNGPNGEITPAESDAKGGTVYARCDLTVTGTGSLQILGNINNGIHSTDNLFIEGGDIRVEARNNGMRGKDSVTVSGGSMAIEVLRKGICGDKELNISGGEILIIKSDEGLEANQIVIDGGTVDINSEDDGINACGGPDSDGKPEKMPNLLIRGGTISVNAEGDGLDSNGNLIVEGGTVIINGPSKDDDGALDYGSENGGICEIHGGTVLAVGSAGMAVTFEESSEQYSLRWILGVPYEAGEEIVISAAGQSGAELYRHRAVKKGASVIFSSPRLKKGETYLLRAGSQSAELTLDAVSSDLGVPGLPLPMPKRPAN